jgi:hypothetical protein
MYDGPSVQVESEILPMASGPSAYARVFQCEGRKYPPDLYDLRGAELGDEVSILDALPLGLCADYLMNRHSSSLKSWISFCILVTGHILYLIRVRLSLVMYL